MFRTSLATAAMLTIALALGPSTAAAQAAPAASLDGAALYRQNCRSCHGLKGAPPARMIAVYASLPKSIGDAAFLQTRSADSIAAVIRNGVGRDMKAFKERLSAEEIAAIARYVKSLPSDSTHAP
jgi:mono/diheme cytochrome c family protein